jgi:hypothetical protein
LGLIRMKADTLHRIDEALVQVRHGTYSHCLDCRQRISDRRLRALPFAARCRECEEARERAARPERHVVAHERMPASVVEMRVGDLTRGGWKNELDAASTVRSTVSLKGDINVDVQ